MEKEDATRPPELEARRTYVLYACAANFVDQLESSGFMALRHHT